MSANTPAKPVRFYQVLLSQRGAWFGAATAALFNAIGMLLELNIVKRTPGVPARPATISASAAFVLLLLLLIRRKTSSVRWASVAYVFTTVNVVTVFLLTDLRFAISEANWVPFQGSKLGCLVAALVAPGFWVGLLGILTYSLTAFLHFEFFFPPGLKSETAPGEPWPIFAFGLAGVLALVIRFRRAQLEQEVTRIQAQNSAIKQLAQVFLDIRDRMNTPLQVIELSVDMLRNSKQPPGPSLDRIDRSVQSLREINSVLVEHEKEIEWEAKR